MLFEANNRLFLALCALLVNAWDDISPPVFCAVVGDFFACRAVDVGSWCDSNDGDPFAELWRIGEQCIANVDRSS